MEVIGWMIPPELLILAAFVGLLFWIFGKKAIASLLLLIGIGPLVIPNIREGITSLIPWWAEIFLMLVFLVLGLKAFVTLVFGRAAADQTVGQITATVVMKLVRLPFVLLSRVPIKPSITAVRKVLNRGNSDPRSGQSTWKMDSPHQTLVGQEDSADDAKNLKQGNNVWGRVVQTNSDGCLIEINDKVNGIVDFRGSQYSEVKMKPSVGDHVVGVIVRVRPIEKLLYLKLERESPIS
ncbi:MAG: hypothetical protein KZQ96_20740 [Candidatus Thiodiazotropha sp. (ex Lucinoma borealis)]|nr:hypothetical protein [Candidatus Thiodiazotropha sp. (ex Lucinoma borealis)]